MPLKRKLISVGKSKAVVIPHDYLDYYRKQGKIINEVGLEINDKIIISPIFIDIEQECKINVDQNIISEIKQHINSGEQQ
jgi:hypothetical protein